MTRPKFPEPATVYSLGSTRDHRLRYIGQTAGLPNGRYHKHLHDARAGVQSPLCRWISGELEAGFEIVMTVVVEAATLDETIREVVARAEAAGYDLIRQRVRAPKRRRVRRTRPTPETIEKMKAARKGYRHSAETKAKIGKASRAAHLRRRDQVQDPRLLPLVRGEGHHRDLAMFALLG